MPLLSLPHLDGIFEKGLKAILDSVENDPTRVRTEVQAAE